MVFKKMIVCIGIYSGNMIHIFKYITQSLHSSLLIVNNWKGLLVLSIEYFDEIYKTG